VTFTDRSSNRGALVTIVALPTGRFCSSNRPSAPVLAVAFPMLTSAPSTTAPVAALTTPDRVAAAAGRAGSLSPHAATRIDVANAIASVEIDVENRMAPQMQEIDTTHQSNRVCVRPANALGPGPATSNRSTDLVRKQSRRRIVPRASDRSRIFYLVAARLEAEGMVEVEAGGSPARWVGNVYFRSPRNQSRGANKGNVGVDAPPGAMNRQPSPLPCAVECVLRLPPFRYSFDDLPVSRDRACGLPRMREVTTALLA
jgi:hypothetical protein